METLDDREGLISSPPELGCALYVPGLPGGSNKVHDRSPYGTHGTITGTTWKRLPSGLWCLSFDGEDDYIDCGNSSSLNPTTALTLEAWVYLNRIDQTQQIIAKDNWATVPRQRSYLLFITLANKPSFVIFYPTDAGSTQVGDTTLSISQWYHVVGTYLYVTNGTSIMDIYLNGVPDATQKTDTGGQIQVKTSSVGIGRRVESTVPEPIGANIGLVRIYNRPLSALEIQNHFNREKHLFGVW